MLFRDLNGIYSSDSGLMKEESEWSQYNVEGDVKFQCDGYCSQARPVPKPGKPNV